MLQIGAKRVVWKNNWMQVIETEFWNRNKEPSLYYSIWRPAPVFVLPITATGELVLIRNYRIPLEQYVLEVPAGLMDTKDQSCEIAGKRELLEETGYATESFAPLPPWPYSPAISNVICHGFIALNAQKIAEPNLEPTETIEVQLMTEADIERLSKLSSPQLYIDPRVPFLIYQAKIRGWL